MTANITPAATITVIVQDESQFSHVVVESFTGENAVANAIMCVESLVADMDGHVARKAEGRDIGMVDIDGQMVQGVMVTNPGTTELSLVAIVREF